MATLDPETAALEEDLSQSVAPRRARRRPRPEHISTPPMLADAEEDSEEDGEEEIEASAPAPKKKRAKKAKAKKAPLPTRDSLALEVCGVVLFAVDVLLALSLVSYSQADTRPGTVAANWIGPGGAVVADVLTIAFGVTAFAVPLLLLPVVVACFRPVARPRHTALRAMAAVSAALAMMTVLHIVFRGTQAFPFPAGGLVGAGIAEPLSRLVAPLGAFVVAAATAFASVVIALDRPLGMTTRTIIDRLVDLWHAATEQVMVWREERRLLAQEAARDADDVDDNDVDAAMFAAEQARQAEREQKAQARKARISDAAQKRAQLKLLAATEESVVEQLEQEPIVVDGAAEPVIAAPMNTARAPIVLEPSLEPVLDETADKTIVQTDPPWAKEIDDGTVISLAEAMEKARRAKAAAASQRALGSEAPSMIVDDELVIKDRDDDVADLVAEAEAQDTQEKQQEKKKREYVLPALNLLDYDAAPHEPLDEVMLRKQADKLIAKFLTFGIEGRVREIRPGPVVTTYEFVPAPGVKVSKIAALSDDIAMAMEAVQVRIVAPIPGKGAVGIEIPNEVRETVYMKEIIADASFKKRDDKLQMALGKDIEGKSYYANLADMPHVLISGTTGSGKSVSVNAMICSILYRATPEDVRFMMIDPKMLELSIYDGIPHLLLPPIIDSKKAATALKWCVAEMERRYQLLSDQGVRDIKGFNDKLAAADAIDDTDPDTVRAGLRDKDGKRLTKMPFIVVIIDEYADLIAVAGKDVEGHVMRLAQKARAAGMHVMLATQRPSVDVITGVIKANFPVRMGFRLASNHDSKTIINQPGAEKLLGRGDMLFMPPGTSNVVRVHGAFISEKELHRVVDHLKQQGTPDYNMDILTYQEEGEEGVSSEELANEPKDARFDEAMALVARTKKCSTSYVQRMLNIGYQRAARIVDRMEREGLVGPALNTKGDRDIYIKPDGSVDASQRINM